MHWLDILILGIGVVSVAYGLKKGVVKEAFVILQILLPFLIAVRMSNTGQKLVQPAVNNPDISPAAGFIVIFAIAVVAIWILGTLLSKTIRLAGLGPIDKILGAVFGVIKAGLIAGFICILILTFIPGGDEYLQTSLLAPKSLYITHKAATLFPADLRDKFSKEFEQLKAIWNKKKERTKRPLQQTYFQEAQNSA